jgi:hypothetical protein
MRPEIDLEIRKALMRAASPHGLCIGIVEASLFAGPTQAKRGYEVPSLGRPLSAYRVPARKRIRIQIAPLVDLA